jgi:hypothetical protein
MTPTINDIESTFKSIYQIMGDPEQYLEVTDQLILLADQVESFEGEGEEIWYLGEGFDFCLTDLFIGAYWHFSEWHGGQETLAYRALSALGSVYTPNMSEPPTKDEPEYYPFEALGEMAHIYWCDTKKATQSSPNQPA